MNAVLNFSLVAIAFTVAGCGASDSMPAAFAEYRIVAGDGSTPTATVGGALRLSVVEVRADGSSTPVPAGARIAWSGPPAITALPVGSTPDKSILPEAGEAPSAMWVTNPSHLSAEELAGVLFVLDAGSAPSPSLNVTVSVVGGSAPEGSATASLPVAPFPVGDVTHGASLYGANCASCHGAHGEGDSAPGLNDEADHVAGDPDWAPQLLGIAARSNMDDLGVSLDPSMPRWLTLKGASGTLLETRDFADIYSFLKTQTGEGVAP